jgi:2-polyprenyl-3-methyl-5-hydroxy-6-metoxy-1,4-benzoquinol methylase
MTTVAGRLQPQHLREALRDTLVYLLGWPALVLQQDPPTWDRWCWLRARLRDGTYRTLDAGSGSGAFAIYAAVRGNVVLGLSSDHEANHRATRRATILGLRRVRFRDADLRQLDALAPELGSFDQILCLETIEHVQEDARLVADLAALLRPGGELLLTTPSAQHLPLVGERLSPSEDGGHVRWGYHPEELRRLLTAAGLRVTAEQYLSGVVCQGLTNLARRLARVVGSQGAWALTAPLRLLGPLDRPLTRMLSYPWLAVALVGVKP